MTTAIATETMILPTGASVEDGFHTYRDFVLYVRWQAELGWTVTTLFRDTRLSVKGRKWQTYVAKRYRRFYYFPTYDTALEAAQEEVDKHTVNGKTWAEWSDYLSKRSTPSQPTV